MVVNIKFLLFITLDIVVKEITSRRLHDNKLIEVVSVRDLESMRVVTARTPFKSMIDSVVVVNTASAHVHHTST